MCPLRYANTPMQYTANLNGCKNNNFQLKMLIFMPPTLKKWEAYCLRLVPPSVCPSVQKIFKSRVLKFHIWIPHQKNSLPVFFFLSELSPLAELCPFEGLKVQICNHDISKTITARSFKLGQLIEDDK